ncbi:MAG: alpha/beta fold hydrolase, partial [Actinomycetota bacterium]|nr:alpha/beta fold hydrolase [Actinomycetota bacterium]
MKPTTVPLVVIHGVGLDHTMWLPVMSALPHRRTVTYDMIGHGSASKPVGPYSLDMFVDQLAGILDALKCEVDLV